MKRLALSFLLACCYIITFAQGGLNGFNYQTIVRDNAGKPMANKSISFRFTVLGGGANGAEQYKETQSITTNSSGLATHVVGTGTAVLNTFAAIPFKDANQFLKVEVDVAGGQNFQLLGTMELKSVPYAQYAASTPYIQVQKVMNINNDLNTLAPGENKTLTVGVKKYYNGFTFPEYTAGAGESALIFFSFSSYSGSLPMGLIYMEAEVSIDGASFAAVSKSPSNIDGYGVAGIANGAAGISVNNLLPLQAGKKYIFSPSIKYTGGAGSIGLTDGYFHGTVVILKN